MQSRGNRESNIELLKIIGLVFVLFCHSVPYYGDPLSAGYVDLHLAADNVNGFMLILMKHCGSLGNLVFLICSSYFLLETDRNKYYKIINLVLDSFFVSVIICILFCVFGVKIPTMTIIKQFFPILSSSNWFVGAYIILYSIHPGLNWIINTLRDNVLLCVSLTMVFIYGGISLLLGGVLYYSDIVGFITVYFVVATIKRCKLINSVNCKRILLVSILLSVFFLIGLNCMGLKYPLFKDKMLLFNKFMNPMYLVIVISLFYTFKNIRISNRIINSIASLSLLVYIITENPLVCMYIKPKIWEWIYYQFGFEMVGIIAIIFSAVLGIIGIILASIYRLSMMKVTDRLSRLIEKLLAMMYSKITQFIGVE